MTMERRRGGALYRALDDLARGLAGAKGISDDDFDSGRYYIGNLIGPGTEIEGRIERFRKEITNGYATPDGSISDRS